MATISLPPALAASVWRGSDLGAPLGRVVPSGWARLDRELPGGGWPLASLVDLLGAEAAALRLLGPALRRQLDGGGSLLLVAPPAQPHPAGLAQLGIDPARLIWLRARSPAETPWSLEQVLASGDEGAVLAWLPQAAPEQLRRLHAAAQAGAALVCVLRPLAARAQACAAPLRLQVEPGDSAEVQVEVFKRRGPPQATPLRLRALPPALDALLPTPDAALPRSPGAARPEAAHAVGRAAAVAA